MSSQTPGRRERIEPFTVDERDTEILDGSWMVLRSTE
jgi:hypothetical protein